MTVACVAESANSRTDIGLTIGSQDPVYGISTPAGWSGEIMVVRLRSPMSRAGSVYCMASWRNI